jgi:hypothetical protein
MKLVPNPALNTDRLQAALAGSLRPSASGGRLAPRWASSKRTLPSASVGSPDSASRGPSLLQPRRSCWPSVLTLAAPEGADRNPSFPIHSFRRCANVDGQAITRGSAPIGAVELPWAPAFAAATFQPLSAGAFGCPARVPFSSQHSSRRRPNPSVNTDRREATLLGPLRGSAAPAAGYLQR